MPVETQLTVSIPNNIGALARLSDMLRAAEVNIEALFCTEGPTHTSVHLVVNDPETAKIVLRQISEVVATDVIAYQVKNKPGAIADLARKCAGFGINIRHIYATSLGKDAMCYLEVDDVEKARKTLK
jgi:hypothetical protein